MELLTNKTTTMKVFILSILFFTILSCHSQIMNVDILFSGKYILSKHTRGSDPENVLESPIFVRLRTNDTLEIKKISNYSINKQKYLKEQGFVITDTVSLVEWDIYGNLNTSLTKLDKVKFIPKDSCLLFYSEKIIKGKENLNLGKWYITPRKFKVLKCTESEVILLDKDILESKRTYYFKAVKPKKKK